MNARPSKPSGRMHKALWVAQVLLALAFAAAGIMKLTTPYEQLAEAAAWVKSVPRIAISAIAASEVTGALGMILPGLTGIKPWLTPLAAVGFIAITVGGACIHLALGEPVVANVVLAGLATFVTWGRLRAAPLPNRNG